MIKILDSTLRDGGYIVGWNFGEKRILNIINSLVLSGIDFIELGFLTNKKTNLNHSLFNSMEQAQRLAGSFSNGKFCLMLKQGEYDVEKIKTSNIFLRYIFKKNNKKTAIIECKKLIDRGIKLFVNPVFIDEYKDDEFLDLMEKISLMNPYAVSVVDSIGAKNESEIEQLFIKLDDIVKKDINFCFHGHNNKERAFICAKTLMNLNLKRLIFIDSTLSGMGRGAGNICSELICSYLNIKYKKNYNIEILFKTIEEELNPIFEKTPWGNSIPYYICANYKCHSEYAGELIKRNIKIEDMDFIFSNIPNDKKAFFDKTYLDDIIAKTNILK